jgi:hypothetical protein
MSALTGTRLSRMISEAREKVKALDDAGRKRVDDGMAINGMEHFKFQEMQAESHATGMLTPEAAQIVYVSLGEVGSQKNGGWAAGTDTATKVIVTQLMGELLSLKLASAIKSR